MLVLVRTRIVKVVVVHLTLAIAPAGFVIIRIKAAETGLSVTNVGSNLDLLPLKVPKGNKTVTMTLLLSTSLVVPPSISVPSLSVVPSHL